MSLCQDRFATPIGDMMLIVEDGALRLLEFADSDRLDQYVKRQFGDAAIPQAVNPAGITEALRAYMAGDVGAIDGLAAKPRGTAFQERVWAELREIPAGKTITYRELAKRAGRPKAVRAVGAANGQNPVSVVVPCHRVIGTDGTLTGYGGGLERKKWLLEHEGALPRAG